MNSKEKMKEESMDEFRKNMTTYETLVNGGMRFKKGSSVIQDGKPEIRYPTMGARQAAGYYVHCNPGHHFLVVYVQNGGEAQYFWEGDFMPEKKNLEDVVELLQVQNQQIQTLLMQKQALTMQSKEIEKTLEDLEKAGDDIYKSVGPILVKATKEDVKKELSEAKEDIDLKLQAIERQENKMKEKIKESQEKFKNLVPDNVGQGG